MSVKTFRKKPVEIQAMQWDGSPEGATPVIDWILTGDLTARYHERQARIRDKSGKTLLEAVPAHIAIDTLEGTMRASAQDWIIRGVQGEFYPCKPDIFAATYEPVDPERRGSRVTVTVTPDTPAIRDFLDKAIREKTADALDEFAALIDRGPTMVKLSPSIFSAMARERAADLRGDSTSDGEVSRG